jgi:hypothetical protein
MVTKHMTDDLNSLTRVLIKCIEDLKVDTFKDYYKSIYGEDEFYRDNQLLDMLEVMTDPYTIWEAEPDAIKQEIEKLIILKESEK